MILGEGVLWGGGGVSPDQINLSLCTRFEKNLVPYGVAPDGG